jgi:hypothetical protein
MGITHTRVHTGECHFGQDQKVQFDGSCSENNIFCSLQVVGYISQLWVELQTSNPHGGMLNEGYGMFTVANDARAEIRVLLVTEKIGGF